MHCDKIHRSLECKCWKNPANKSKDSKDECSKWDCSTSNGNKNYITKSDFKMFANVIVKSIKATAAKKKDDSDASGNKSELNLNVTQMNLCPKNEKNFVIDQSSILSDKVSETLEQCHVFNEHNCPTKKQNKYHLSCEIIVEIEDRNGNLKPIKALLDTRILLYCCMNLSVRVTPKCLVNQNQLSGPPWEINLSQRKRHSWISNSHNSPNQRKSLKKCAC